MWKYQLFARFKGNELFEPLACDEYKDIDDDTSITFSILLRHLDQLLKLVSNIDMFLFKRIPYHIPCNANLVVLIKSDL